MGVGGGIASGELDVASDLLGLEGAGGEEEREENDYFFHIEYNLIGDSIRFTGLRLLGLLHAVVKQTTAMIAAKWRVVFFMLEWFYFVSCLYASVL
jgi:hypothetical protein